MYPSHNIAMRHSRLDEDVRTLAGLAIFGSRPEPRGTALLAEVDGAPRAAQLSDGSVAVDPSVATVELVELRLCTCGSAVAEDTRKTWRARVKSIVLRSQPACC